MMANNPAPAGGGGGSPSTPVFYSVTNIVDSANQFTTNTIDVQGANPIIINVAHVFGTTGTGAPTNYANGILMTNAYYTNGYNNATEGFNISYLVPPSNGLYNVANNNQGAPSEHSHTTIIYTNVHQTTPWGQFVAFDSVGTTATGTTNTVTSAANDLIFDAIGWNVGAVGSVGASQTRRGLADPGADDASIATSEKASEGSSSTMRWSGFSAGRIVWIGAALKGP